MSRSAVLAALLATLCVSGVVLAGAAAAGSGEELTKKQFLKAANATCKDAYEEVDAVFEEQIERLGANQTPTAGEIETVIASVTGILDTAAADVEALVGPAALERQVDRFLNLFNKVVAKFEDDPQGMFEKELTGYPFEKPDTFARKIGLGRCAQRQS